MTNASGIELSASLEDYLEAILWIIQDKQAVRASDIGRRLNVGRSSVTGALRALAQRDLINYAPYDVITLTGKGKKIAQDVAHRHEVLRNFFIKVLAVDKADADAAACKIEHDVGEDILRRFVEFVELVERCPHEVASLVEEFGKSGCGAAGATARRTRPAPAKQGN